jgi:type II secretory pathway component PulJ
MSSKPLLLEGEDRGQRDFQAYIASLREEVNGLLRQLDDTRAQLVEARGEADLYRRIVNDLRQVLNPLYTGLRQIYGHMEGIPGPQGSAGSTGSSSISDAKRQVWQEWIQKLPGARANFISALLTHKEMNAKQLRVVMKCRIETVYDAAKALYKLGLIEKRGTNYALKDL